MGAPQRNLILGPEFVALKWLGHARGGGGGFIPRGEGGGGVTIKGIF